MSSLLQFLRDNGLNELEADLWSQFISASIGAIRQAQSQLMSSPKWAKFATKTGAVSKPRKVQGIPGLITAPLEDGITDELGHCLRRIVKAASNDDIIKLRRIHFETQPAIELPHRTGKTSRRGDIVAVSSDGADAPELVFEAKVLTAEADIANDYLGSSGIGCFTSKDAPYTEGPFGAMLAYVISETCSWWATKISLELTGPPPIGRQNRTLKVDGEAEPVVCSEFDRDAPLGTLAVFHFVMKFEQPPRPRSVGRKRRK